MARPCRVAHSHKVDIDDHPFDRFQPASELGMESEKFSMVMVCSY